MKAKRTRAGMYTVEARGRVWELESIEARSEGECRTRGWVLFERDDEEPDGRVWWNTFATKGAAIEAIEEGLNEERADSAKVPGSADR